jgi:hypothetical protein
MTKTDLMTKLRQSSDPRKLNLVDHLGNIVGTLKIAVLPRNRKVIHFNGAISARYLNDNERVRKAATTAENDNMVSFRRQQLTRVTSDESCCGSLKTDLQSSENQTST